MSLTSTPAAERNISATRWVDEPTPSVATFRLPGLAFASATRLFTLSAGTEGCATSTNGVVPVSATGLKSAASRAAS